MRSVRKVLRGLDSGFEWLTLLCLLAVVFVVLFQIFSRELLSSTPSWSEETARTLMIWIGFLCTAIAFREGAHIAVTFVADRLPRVARRVVDVIVSASTLSFGLYLLVLGAQFTADTRFATLPGTGLPRSVLYVMMPVAGAAICVYAALQMAGIDTRRYSGPTDVTEYE